MNAQAVPADLDAMFDLLLDELDAALELSVLPDRNQRLEAIAAHCAAAASLTAKALADR